MKRIVIICIVIILLRTIYMYASAVEIYSVEESEEQGLCRDTEESDWSETENDMAEEALSLDKTEDGTEDFADVDPYIDYDYVEKYHRVLAHNISNSPNDDYYDMVLAEYLREDIEKDKELLDAGSGEEKPLTIDYHLFDFNDDGLEDYLVCYHGSLWSGTAGNHVGIYIQESDGSLNAVFFVTMRLYEGVPGEHSPIAILDEKDDGYYAFVLPGTNRIIRYNKEKGGYEFADE